MKRILYIDLSPSPGGCTISLFQLVSHLDRALAQPLVVLSALAGWVKRCASSRSGPVSGISSAICCA